MSVAVYAVLIVYQRDATKAVQLPLSFSPILNYADRDYGRVSARGQSTPKIRITHYIPRPMLKLNTTVTPSPAQPASEAEALFSPADRPAPLPLVPATAETEEAAPPPLAVTVENAVSMNTLGVAADWIEVTEALVPLPDLELAGVGSVALLG